MNMINLLGNMGPSQDEPEEIEEAQDKEEKTEPEIRTITWCGCGWPSFTHMMNLEDLISVALKASEQANPDQNQPMTFQERSLR